MSRPTRFSLQGDRLHCFSGRQLPQISRILSDKDRGEWDSWSKDYQLLLSKGSPINECLTLGQRIRDWLDGPERCLDNAKELADPPWEVEFVVPQSPNAAKLSFLEVPWELLADSDGHLAQRDTLQYNPIRRIGVPGRPPSPSRYQLSVMFMAAAPNKYPPLDYEAEEVEIVDAAGNLGLDLFVEDSGNLVQLAASLVRDGAVDVIHIACHGTIQPSPAILLEDEQGDAETVSAGDLWENFSHHRPRLLFLSACHSADPASPIGSVAARSVSLGLPAVLGWGAPVLDWEARKFASSLCHHLRSGARLGEAVGHARRALWGKGKGEGPKSNAWHVAPLYLRPKGGGKLAVGDKTRQPRRSGEKAFLDPDREVQVAAAHEFVGRRREIQAILRVLRSGPGTGVLIHGMGRQGKSSLAAHIARRLHRYTTVVVFGRYSAIDIRSAFRDQAGGGKADALIDRAHARVQRSPASLERTLTDLLQGPYGQWRGRLQQPVLVVVDGLEQVLEPSPYSGLHRVRVQELPVLRALLRAFAAADTDSRLLLTSRYRFTLPDDDRDLADALHHIPLGPMAATERRKQADAKLRALNGAEAGKSDSGRIARCIDFACGNPGLQDQLFQLAVKDPLACDKALQAMDAYLGRTSEPNGDLLKRLLDDLDLDQWVQALRPSERQLLRISTLFEVPVPEGVLREMGREAALDLDDLAWARLPALGLWESFPELWDPSLFAYAINDLVRPLPRPLGLEEQRLLAAIAIRWLSPLWVKGDGTSPAGTDTELVRLALIACDGDILMRRAAIVVQWMGKDRSDYKAAVDVGRRAIECLDAKGFETPLDLLRTAADACMSIGDLTLALGYVDRGLERTDAGRPTRAAFLRMQGDLHDRAGRHEQAEQAFAAAQKLLGEKFAERIGTDEEINQARTLGEIAGQLASLGRYEEALRVHREEELPVYERLGEERAVALTRGKMAEIMAKLGLLD